MLEVDFVANNTNEEVRRSKEVQYWRDTRVQYIPIFQFTSIDILVSFQVPISIANDTTSAYG